MAKLPYLQLHPDDWLSDEVARCPPLAERLWFRMLFVMHKCTPRGYLIRDGKPIPEEVIASLCGVTLKDYRRHLAELDLFGVPSRTDEGVVFSRRMVKDSKKIEQGLERWRRHNEKDKQRGDANEAKSAKQTRRKRSTNAPLTQDSQESNGQETQRFRDKEETPNGVSPPTPSAVASGESASGAPFDRFWKRYPKRAMRPDALAAFAVAIKKATIEEILEGLERWIGSEDWSKDGGRFIPRPAKWLKGECWNDDPKPAPGVVRDRGAFDDFIDEIEAEPEDGGFDPSLEAVRESTELERRDLS